MREAGRTHGELFSEVPKLGPQLTSSIPTPREGHGPPAELDVEGDQNLNSKYVFSGVQRELVKTGDVNERSKRNEGVLKKRDRLPERIQHLIEDIALLHDTAYLSDERWKTGKVDRKNTQTAWADFHRQRRANDGEASLESVKIEEREVEHYESPFDSPSELWEELISIDQRSQQVQDNILRHGASAVSTETEFGYEIGSLLRILRPDREEDIPGSELIWGFILAFIGQSRDALDQEEKMLDELITKMRDNHDSRRKDAERAPDLDDPTAFTEPAEEVTAEGIKEAGFEPHSILVREVLHHQPVLENDEHHKNAVKQLVSKIADTVPLRQVDQLYSQLTQDLSTLESRSVPGIESAQLVIEGHMIADDSDSSGTDPDDSVSGKELDDESVQNAEESKASSEKEGNSVPEAVTKNGASISTAIGVDDSVGTTVLNRLSADGNGELWTTRSIFDNKDDGWRPTPYGRLLAHVTHRRGGDTDLLYWFALGPEEVTLYERKLIVEAINAEEGFLITPSDRDIP